MEDDHRYFPTPTRDSRFGSTHHSAHCPTELSPVGRSRDSTPSYLSRGRKKFINTRSFCTLATKLSTNSEQQTGEVGSDIAAGLDEVSCDINCSHSEVDIKDSDGSEIECNSPCTNTSHLHNSSSNLSQSTLSPQTLLSSQTVSVAGNHPDLNHELTTFADHRMGSLLRNAGLTDEKPGSLGFSTGDSRCIQDDATDKYSMDLPQISVRQINNMLAGAEKSSCSENETHDTIVFNSEAYPTEPSLKPGIHVSEVGQLDSWQGQDDVTSVNQLLMSAHYEQVHYPEPMVTDNNDQSVDSHLLSDEHASQNPLPFLSPTKLMPIFRRQLSKRKSDIFEPFLPQSVHIEHDDDDDDDEFFSVGGSQGRRSDPCTPTTPKTRRLENYDPYQIFEVQHSPCLILTVMVLRGRNITLGFQDYYDTPDPYINLILRTSPEGKKSTTVKQNDPNPVWNESFTFYINFTQSNILEIDLMESNSVWFDQKVGTVYYDVTNIRDMDKPQVETFVFNSVSQVDIEFKLEFDRNPTLRYSLCLSSQEKEFIEQRKEKTLQGIRKLLGEEDGPLNIDEVPTIAVIGSGGGFRAMTGYSGVIKAISESGILDCTTYACGLSGSSWLLSTLYSHPKWPNLDMREFLDELKHNIDKSLLRFLNATTMYSYMKFMIQKRKDGQPVSFTDIFGRMVGETLLKGRMETTLSDQREKIKDGSIPMPLYTCVHVKKDVPARSFQEWVEFSPYEIGLPKYGTFMDSELFGSKFFMGKLVKQYKEQPLHFLQGIWGSAFCILFKRLLEDNRRIDPVEMVRQEMGKQLDEAGQESSSDCSDDDIDDSTDSDDESEQNTKNSEHPFLDVTDESSPSTNVRASPEVAHNDSINNLVTERQNSGKDIEESSNKSDEIKGQQKVGFHSQDSSDVISTDDNESDSAYEGEEEDCEEDDDDETEVTSFHSQRMIKRGSVEMKRSHQKHQSSKDSASPENDLIQEQNEVLQLPANPINELNQKSLLSKNELDQVSDRKKSVNWGACPTLGRKAETGESKQKRQAFISGTSARKSRSGSKSYWNQLLKKVFESNSWELLSTRRGRAAVIHNFMRGLSLQQSYPLSPFTPVEERVKAGDEFDGIFEMHPTSVKHIYMVDAGLTFNSPFPLVLRPQREVDVILSFDFSARDSDNSQPFKELLLAEKWARLNRLPFPPIDTSVFEREGMKEMYVFRHPTDPHCPIVCHFVLINKRFKYYKKPGVPRETKEEFEFAEFDIFDDPKAPFSTFNFTYAHKNFERLSQLMEFNTLLHIDDIKEVIKEAIKKKREGPPRLPIQSKDIKLLRMKSVQEMRKLRRFISRIESRSSLYSSTSPSTPFCTPTPNSETSTNPFFSRCQQEVSVSPSNDTHIPSTPTDRLSESFSRNARVKKHLHPNDRISESEEINYHKFAEKDDMRKSSLSPNPSSSFESVFDTIPDNSDHFHHLGQTSSLVEANPSMHQPQSVDFCDVPTELSKVVQHDLKYSPEKNNSKEGNNTVVADHLCINTFPCMKADATLVQNYDKKSQLPPLAKLPGTLKFNQTQTDSTGTQNSSGFGSLGGEMGIDGIRTGCINTDISGKRTPGTGTFSIDSSTSEHLGSGGSDKFISKGKLKSDMPSNPFFAKAFFMRPAQTSSLSPSSSNSSSSSLNGNDSGDDRMKYSRGVSYRLSPQTLQSSNSPEDIGSTKSGGRLNSRSPRLSPLVVSSNHKPQSLAQVQPLPSPNTSEIFTLAPEAFKADGTPVFDSEQAKMYYESAKSKRKYFRRQSTVSSLKNISLEENEPSQCEISHKNQEGCDDDGQRSPNKKKMIHSDTSFTDIFKTCDGGFLSDISDTVKPQTVLHTTGYGVAFDIHDLSQFTEAQDSDMQQVSQSSSPEVLCSGKESHNHITWYDAEDSAI